MASTCLLVLGVCFWFTTFGTGSLLVHDPLGSYYDGLARSLLKGHWDVHPADLPGEGYVVNGKTYGYFGPVPALPRMALNQIFPSLYGRWTRLSMGLGVAAHLALLALLLRHLGCPLGRPLVILYLISSILGSTTLLVASHAVVYHEAVLWGSALALASGYSLFRYIDSPTTGWAWAAGALAAASFFTRPVSGAGALAAVAILAAFTAGGKAGDPQQSGPRSRSGAAVLILWVLGAFAAYVTLNQIRFGTTLNGAPLKYHVQYTPERLARVQGTLFHPENLSYNAAELLSPLGIRLRGSFPWIDFRKPHEPRPAALDLMESHTSIPAAMPGLAVLSLIGLIRVPRTTTRPQLTRAVLLGFGVALLLLLAVAAITQRYLQDAIPFLTLSSAWGVRYLSPDAETATKKFLIWLCSLLLIWSIAVNLSLTLIYQGETAWDWTISPEFRARYRSVQLYVDSFRGVRR